MTSLKRLATALACCFAPSMLIGQAVELRSSDDFISVAGEITGFDGTMVTIRSSVGPVSLPASAVICYGPGCAAVLADNSFGLTAAAFADVMPDAAPATDSLPEALTIGFAGPVYESLYRHLTTAFAASDLADLTVDLAPATGAVPADVFLGPAALLGRAEQVYAAPIDWAMASAPPAQMVALRAFAIIASPDVGVASIRIADLAAIYAGEVTNWSQIGGADLDVLPLQLPATSALRDAFIAAVMDPAGKVIADNILTMADEDSIAAAINGFAGSISIVAFGNAGPAKLLSVAGACGVAVLPNDFTIASGDYPLLGPVIARVDRPAATSLPAHLFDFATSDAAQKLIAPEGFVSHAALRQSAVERNIRLTGLLTGTAPPEDRPVAAQMYQALFAATRLSPTMSGGPASAVEGAWNRAMMANLAQILAAPDFAGRQVIFAGFGNSDAGGADALDRSAAAAEAMAAAFAAFAPDLLAANDLTLTALGFGDLSQASCPRGQVAGPAHSRIEIWVK